MRNSNLFFVVLAVMSLAGCATTGVGYPAPAVAVGYQQISGQRTIGVSYQSYPVVPVTPMVAVPAPNYYWQRAMWRQADYLERETQRWADYHYRLQQRQADATYRQAQRQADYLARQAQRWADQRNRDWQNRSGHLYGRRR